MMAVTTKSSIIVKAALAFVRNATRILLTSLLVRCQLNAGNTASRVWAKLSASQHLHADSPAQRPVNLRANDHSSDGQDSQPGINEIGIPNAWLPLDGSEKQVAEVKSSAARREWH